MDNLIKLMPAIALRGTTILPDMIVHFDVSRKKSVKAIEEAMTENQRIFLITQRDPQIEDPGIDDLYKVGTIAVIKQVVKMPKDMLRVLVEGMERAELINLTENLEYLEAETAGFDLQEEKLPENLKEAMVRTIKDIFLEYCQENRKISKELANKILENDDIEQLVDQISIHLPLEYEQRQRLLEAVSFNERYELLGMIMSNEIEIMKLRMEIQKKVKDSIDQNQREYILREQLKLIRKELGEDDKITVARARRVRNFLSQPFTVASQFTGMEGKYVRVQDTIKGFKEILEGKYDHLPEQAFHNVGTIEEAIAKAETLG